MRRRRLQVTHGRGGWVRVEEGAGLPGPLFVRFLDDGAVGELYLAADKTRGEITAADLRQLPLANIAAVAMGQPELFQPAAESDADVWVELEKIVPLVRRPQRFQVTLSPPERGLDDDFLQRVADAYRAAAARGERPNVALAEQAGYPIRTVERWVYLARKRGFLPPTRRGAVG